MKSTIALFGEAEKGEFERGIICRNLPELLKNLGQPPEESLAIHFAVQALHHEHQLIFFRVREEGFSQDDYLGGLNLLESADQMRELHAICAPGVGDSELIHKIFNVCILHESLLITNQRDLYDFLISGS